MKNLPANLVIEKNKLATASAWLILLEITLTDNTVFRLVRNNEDIYFTTDNYSDVGCVGHWKLNDNLETSVVVDSSGKSNTGTVTNDENNYSSEQYNASGKINGCFDFDGTNDAVVVTDTTDFDFSTAFSAFCWIKPTAVGDADGIITKYLSTGELREWGFVLSDPSGADAKLKVVLGTAGGTGTTSETTDDLVISNGSWYHVGFTYNAGVVTIYVNGIVVDSTRTGTHVTTVNNEAVDLEVGRFNGSAHFDGSVDDVRLYNVPLTSEEVSAMYNSGNGTEYLRTKYTAFNFELEPTEQGNSGEIPSVTLRVSNITRLIESYLQDLDGGIGSTVKMTVVNSDLLAESYSELEMTFDVLACNTTSQWVVFTLGAPSPLRQRFPLDKYLALHCRFRFNRPSGNYPECGYAGESIEGITLPSGNPVSINITGHPFSTGDVVSFLDVGGTTELNGNSYTVTKIDADNFTLDSTDGDDFTAWTAGGTAGFATCKRTLSDCRIRENAVRFGGFPGMRSGGIRIA